MATRRRPRIGPALARQLRDHPPPESEAGAVALARSLAARIDALDTDAAPTGAAALARVLSSCLDRLQPPAPAESSDTLVAVLDRLSAASRDPQDRPA